MRDAAPTGGRRGASCCARRTRGWRTWSTRNPALDPDRLFDGLPSDLWGALVLQVIGQQLSLAAAAAILDSARGAPQRSDAHTG